MNEMKKSQYVAASYWAVIGSTTTVISVFTFFLHFSHRDWKDMVIGLPYFLLYGTIVWSILVLPFVSLAPRNPFVSGLSLTWLTWAAAASLGFMLFSLLLYGQWSLSGVPFIALIGALAGVSFSLYIRARSQRGKNHGRLSQ